MKKITLVTLSVLLLAMLSCKKDKDLQPLPPPVTNSPELITSMKLIFTDSANTSNVYSAFFNDPDGPGGNGPLQFDTIKLSSNKTYLVNLILLDQTKNPGDTVSKEIWNERDDHLFFFQHSGINIQTLYMDVDSKNLPVGLSTKWRTAAAAIGTSKVTLKHQAGTKNGSITPGETDVEVLFQTKIN
jgi:hypothetical protein